MFELAGGGAHIHKFRLYGESLGAAGGAPSLDGPWGAAVSANLLRLNGHDCKVVVIIIITIMIIIIVIIIIIIIIIIISILIIN